MWISNFFPSWRTCTNPLKCLNATVISLEKLKWWVRCGGKIKEPPNELAPPYYAVQETPIHNSELVFSGGVVLWGNPCVYWMFPPVSSRESGTTWCGFCMARSSTFGAWWRNHVSVTTASVTCHNIVQARGVESIQFLKIKLMKYGVDFFNVLTCAEDSTVQTALRSLTINVLVFFQQKAYNERWICEVIQCNTTQNDLWHRKVTFTEAILVRSRGGPKGWDIETRTFSRQSAHRWMWGCQPHAPAAL
jgi:hypothetical protein